MPPQNHERVVDFEQNYEDAPHASAAACRKQREGRRFLHAHACNLDANPACTFDAKGACTLDVAPHLKEVERANRSELVGNVHEEEELDLDLLAGRIPLGQIHGHCLPCFILGICTCGRYFPRTRPTWLEA